MTQKAKKYLTLWKYVRKIFPGFDLSYHMIFLTCLE